MGCENGGVRRVWAALVRERLQRPTVVKIATDAIHAAYHAVNADDHFLLRIQPNTAHQVRPESEAAGVEWLVKWLRPGV